MVKKVSVLVAVHNCVEWLPRCLDSLCTQSYGNIEVICADDASTDGSSGVIDEYVQKYDFIKKVTLPVNRGIAVARNEAFRISTGDYVTMLDSDDWFSADALERAVEVLDKYEDTASVLFRLVYHDEVTGVDTEFENKCVTDVIDGMDAMRLALDWGIHGLYVARRWLYEKFPYDAASVLYSDENTVRRHYLHSGKVRFCDGIYYYFQRTSSMTHNPGMHYADIMEATASLKCMLVDEQQPDSYINHIEERLWQNIVAIGGYYWRYRHTMTKEQQCSLLHRIKKHHANVELHRLPRSLKLKFGFIPFKGCFSIFMAQVRIYFYLRKLIKGI